MLSFRDFTLKLVTELCEFTASVGRASQQQAVPADPAVPAPVMQAPIAFDAEFEDHVSAHVLAHTRDLPEADADHLSILGCDTCTMPKDEKPRARIYCKGCKETKKRAIFYCYAETDKSDGKCYIRHTEFNL